MSITNKMVGWLAATGLLLIATLASSGAYAGLLIPGITDPSVPQFLHNVKVQAHNGSWTARTNNGNKDFTFRQTPTVSYIGDGFKFNFSATFNKQTGIFEGGSMSIQGSIANLGITDKKTVLMSADLTSFGQNGNIVGFNTDNIFCDPGLGVACTPAESVVFFLASYDGDPLGMVNTTALAITSVPIPAAVWLFGSGLGLMGVTARRRRKKVA